MLEADHKPAPNWHTLVADAIDNGDLDNFVKAKDPDTGPVSACLAKGCKLPGGHEVVVLGDYSHAPAPITDTNRAMRRRLLKARGVFGNRKRYDHR